MTNEIQKKVNRWIRPEIRELSAYHVPDQNDYVKLDAMENPYSWPESLVEAWQEKLKAVRLNRYPDPSAHALEERLRACMDIPSSSTVIFGNGSDELIQMIALAVGGNHRVILAPEPAFVMYRMIATFAGLDFVGVPLKDDFSLAATNMLQAIKTHEPAVIFLAYPNNPTGNLFDEQAIEDIIKAAPGIVVIDEAYAPFSDKSFMSRLGDHDNLLVMRTLSKSGLAGLRLGYLVGPSAWLSEINKVRLPYNINTLTQVSAEFALEHREVLDEQASWIRKDRENLLSVLIKLEGLTVYPSDANFILFRVPSGQAGELFSLLKADGVLIKNLDGSHDMLKDCLRVTVGTAEENTTFIEGLTRIFMN